MFEPFIHSFTFAASIACFIVGIIHCWLSFKDIGANVHWSRGNFITENDLGWQHAFRLTPEAVVHHWQPMLIGWIAMTHHVCAARYFSAYRSWLQMCGFYLFVCFFGCFGYAGNLGIIAGCIALLASAIGLVMAFMDGSRAPEPIWTFW